MSGAATMHQRLKCRFGFGDGHAAVAGFEHVRIIPMARPGAGGQPGLGIQIVQPAGGPFHDVKWAGRFRQASTRVRRAGIGEREADIFGHGLRARTHMKFFVDAPDVGVHGADTDVQRGGDFLVEKARANIPITSRSRGERSSSASIRRDGWKNIGRRGGDVARHREPPAWTYLSAASNSS